MSDSNIINLGAEDPLASKLRNAVKKACDPNRPVIISADAQGNIKATPPTEVKLTPFSNGMLFGYTPNLKRPPSCFIHDAAGLNVALAVAPEIADILCRGAHLFFQAAQKEIADAKAKEEAATPDREPGVEIHLNTPPPAAPSATVLDAADKENEQ